MLFRSVLCTLARPRRFIVIFRVKQIGTPGGTWFSSHLCFVVVIRIVFARSSNQHSILHDKTPMCGSARRTRGLSYADNTERLVILFRSLPPIVVIELGDKMYILNKSRSQRGFKLCSPGRHKAGASAKAKREHTS